MGRERQHPEDEGHLNHLLVWWWLRRLVLLGLEVVIRWHAGN